MRVAFTAVALADLKDIFDFIAADSPMAARRYVRGLRVKARGLGRFPKIHPLRNDLPDELRAAPYGSHQILYRIKQRDLEIARVVHGAMDLSRIFEK